MNLYMNACKKDTKLTGFRSSRVRQEDESIDFKGFS